VKKLPMTTDSGIRNARKVRDRIYEAATMIQRLAETAEEKQIAETMRGYADDIEWNIRDAVEEATP